MEIRFRLDDNIYADLIEKILEIASNSHPAKAMPRILLEWYMLKYGDNVAKIGHSKDNIRQDMLDNEIDFSSLDDKFKSLGE